MLLLGLWTFSLGRRGHIKGMAGFEGAGCAGGIRGVV